MEKKRKHENNYKLLYKIELIKGNELEFIMFKSEYCAVMTMHSLFASGDFNMAKLSVCVVDLKKLRSFDEVAGDSEYAEYTSSDCNECIICEKVVRCINLVTQE